jgi:hypothetical protein
LIELRAAIEDLGGTLTAEQQLKCRRGRESAESFRRKTACSPRDASMSCRYGSRPAAEIAAAMSRAGAAAPRSTRSATSNATRVTRLLGRRGDGACRAGTVHGRGPASQTQPEAARATSDPLASPGRAVAGGRGLDRVGR